MIVQPERLLWMILSSSCFLASHDEMTYSKQLEQRSEKGQLGALHSMKT